MARTEPTPNPNCKRADCPVCGHVHAGKPVVETRPADDAEVETR